MGTLELQKLIISIHAPAKGATLNNDYNSRMAQISIHAPAKGATRILWWLLLALVYFNPRSREGSDLQIMPLVAQSLISIHAPAKGATSSSVCGPFGCAISIHAPAKGATIFFVVSSLKGVYFNPRSREGSDVLH